MEVKENKSEPNDLEERKLYDDGLAENEAEEFRGK